MEMTLFSTSAKGYGSIHNEEATPLNMEETIVADDDADDECADNDALSIFTLFNDSNYAAIKDRLRNGKVSDEELVSLNADLSVLDLAARHGNFEIVSLILERTDYKCIPEWNGSPIANAARSNSKSIVDLLLTTYGSAINLNYVDDNGNGALSFAVAYSYNEILQILVQGGANVNIPNVDGDTPLLLAVQWRNRPGMDQLLQAGANLNHLNCQEKSALCLAVEADFVSGVEVLLMAGAEIDLKDFEGKYILQRATSDIVKTLLKNERIFRVSHPIHRIARNGNVAGLHAWLSHVAANGPGVHGVWRGQREVDGVWSDDVLKVNLSQNVQNRSVVVMGRSKDARGEYGLIGGYVRGAMMVVKVYTNDEDGVSYTGEVDEETGNWVGEWEDGSKKHKGEFRIHVPLYLCPMCKAAKIPIEDEACGRCRDVKYHDWEGEEQNPTSGQWTWFGLEVSIEADPNGALYRIRGKPGGVLSLTGVWEAGRIHIDRFFNNNVQDSFDGAVDPKTNIWSGTYVGVAGTVENFRLTIPMWPCTQCNENIPTKESLCLTCIRSKNTNWRGCLHRGDVRQDVAFQIFSGRDDHKNCFRLVGEGTDNGDERYDAFGTWQDHTIELTKIYANKCVHFSGTLNSETKEWSGQYAENDSEPEDFIITVPVFACVKCAIPIPTANELCVTCTAPAPAWKSENGSLFHAWVGQCRHDRLEWTDTEFSVSVFRDLATESYRFVGYDKDDNGHFATTGVSNGETIHMERTYRNGKASLDGKFDSHNAVWTGTQVTEMDDENKSSLKFRYTVPMWPCTKCAKPVPVEEKLCFGCDNTPRDSTAPLELGSDEQSVHYNLAFRERISTLINERDHAGRTILMHAAQCGRLNIVDELLQYLNLVDLRTISNDGKTALDIALSQKLVCATNSNHESNDELLNCIELIRRRSSLQVKTSVIPNHFSGKETCSGDCKNTLGASSEKDVCLYKLAKEQRWDELHNLLKSQLHNDILNEKDPQTGSTVTHLVCREGNVRILKSLLAQEEINLYEFMYPLYEAVQNDRIQCVTALLHAGVSPTALEYLEADDFQLTLVNPKARCYRLVIDKYKLKETPSLNLYYKANVQSIAQAQKYTACGQTALHAAIINGQSKTNFDALVQDDRIDVNDKDQHGNTALMIAARGELTLSKDYVEILLLRDADIDATNNDGITALMIAALAGCVEIVIKLLKQMAEIDIEDNNGQTCLELVSKCDMGSLKDPTSPFSKIKELLIIETQIRANSTEFRDKLAKSLIGMTAEEAFIEQGFRKAINCSPDLARSFLDDCVEINRHDVKFSLMNEMYGDDTQGGTLDAILNLKTDDPEFILEARKQCLEHVVTRRLMEIKWELFGQRKYLEQLLMNILLLVATTISSIVFDDILNISSGPLIIGVAVAVFTVVGYILVQLLRPKILWSLARYGHDGSFAFDPRLDIPSLATKKTRAKLVLAQLGLFLTTALVLPILYGMATFKLEPYFAMCNNIVLELTVAFFLATELQEARANVFKYFESNINKAQMLVYLLIFFVFVPMKVNLFVADMAVQIGIGGFITIVLWVLTVQFLEVVPSASYLLPMMSNLLQDVWNFFIFFGVFQMGLTISFYQLFRHQDDEAFGTIGQSFVTTYFVAFGQLPLDSIKSFSNDGVNDDFLSTCATILMMFHSAVVVILLLNVLLAMMNKTVDVGIEKAKTEALASYGYCILRLEESMNLNKASTCQLIYFEDPFSRKVLNPIFNELVPKSQLRLPAEQEKSIKAHEDKKTAWVALMDSIQNTVIGAIDTLESSLRHVQHFTSLDVHSVFKAEYLLIGQARNRVTEHVDLAKKSRGQDPETVLKSLDARVKKELSTLEDKLKLEWKPKLQRDSHKKCALLHQMVQKVDIEEMLKTLKSNVQTHFDKVAKDLKSKVAAEPTLSDLMVRFDTVDSVLKDKRKLCVESTNADVSSNEVEELKLHILDISKQNDIMARRLEEMMKMLADMKN
ncbi:Aste57867_22884 [Aphanomyces stellatus]|uniref:Aste57867_22884 protein n=1 Tax=Aphanomyces stellatus TaxID=120398 RepID=A0A485LQY1_9STRA|nr:hypothetical protein As57867_022813 [Aphanomyces stellatus]VFT99534.1 Aste57867_22884 [Aphanomyces stellatus]